MGFQHTAQPEHEHQLKHKHERQLKYKHERQLDYTTEKFFPSLVALVPLPVCRLAFRRATYVYFSPACGMSHI